ncbi:MAG: glutamate synthase [bacterium]|nr:MAG: glutamate synthase [bacterium]
MTISLKEPNPMLDAVKNYQFPEYEMEKGLERVVAFGEVSHKCPTYLLRVPPCTAGCPADEDIRGYHNILRGVEKFEDKWKAAFDRITEKNPFPAVMGRVCPAPCESACNRQYLDEAVGINAVEHAIGNYAIEKGFKFDKPTTSTGKHIAVVGSGPAGLSCAYHLALKGHKVTLYEAFDTLGGMMRLGILEYRVPIKVLDAEVQRIIDLGIEVKMGVKIGKDITLDQLRKDHDAVFMGIGAQKGRDLPVPGSDNTSGVSNSIDFLREYVAKDSSMHVGKKVIVIGDGDVAMDALRLALRLGCKDVNLISGVSKEDMKCSALEFHEAQSEGAKFQYSVGSQGIETKDGKASGLKVVQMQPKEQGEEGWNSPIPFLRYKPVPGTESTIEADMIISSIGQGLDLEGLESLKNGGPWLKVNKVHQIPDMPDVFSGGDALSLTLLTTAIGHGRVAAEKMDAYVNGRPLTEAGRQDVIPFEDLASYYFPHVPQLKRNHRKIDKVVGDFKEILENLDQATTQKESERCMSCGLCFECNECLLYCPQEAITKFKKNPIGEVMYTIYDKCVGCHICSEVCPSGYIHMGMGEDL